MATFHKLLKINAPVPALHEDKAAFQATVYNPDDGTMNTLYIEVDVADANDSAAWFAAICAIDNSVEGCS